MNASQLLAKGAKDYTPQNWERIAKDNEMSDLLFSGHLSMIDSILWIDPTTTVETYDFSTNFLDIKARLHVGINWREHRISETEFHQVDVSHKTREPIELSDSQYEDLIKAIEGKLRLRPIVETD